MKNSIKHRSREITFLIVFTMLGMTLPLQGAAAGLEAHSKIDPLIVDGYNENDKVDFFVKMVSDASLSQATSIIDRVSRIQSVKDTLENHAGDTQAAVLQLLRDKGVSTEVFWINNSIFVRGASSDLAKTLADRADVAYLRGNRKVPLVKPVEVKAASNIGVDAIEWGINIINAPAVWATGNQGEGIVVANIDTGVRYTHNALINQYRGATTLSHDYNWWDPDQTLAKPTDSDGHGTHTMGTMVGDDGGTNMIGVAPGATWIAAQGCGTSFCSSFDLISSAQWVACPTKRDGSAPDCSKAPHVVNNSWGGGGGDSWYQSYVNSWLAAGIVPVFSAGNSGSNCNTIGSPGDYTNTISVGATDINDTLASFSSKGPSSLGSGFKQWQPYIVAPGSNVRSSYNSNDSSYASLSGTSMAAPHLAGVVALMLNKDPTASVMEIATALAQTTNQSLPAPPGPDSCGGRAYNQYPNAIHGFGRVDAEAAVNAL